MDKDSAEETLNSLRVGSRPKWLVPTKIFDKEHKWHCCHVECNKLADVVISGDAHYDDYTHMCNEHKGLYVADYNNPEVEDIIRINK